MGSGDLSSCGDAVRIQQLIEQLAEGNPYARDELIVLTAERLRRLTATMLRGYPGLRRWEQTDDVFQTAVIKLHRSLSEVEIQSPKHFFNLAATQVRRTLIDLCRRYFGPQGRAVQHHSDAELVGNIADHAAAVRPESLEAWNAFHNLVAKLPEAEREVFEVIWYGGMSQTNAMKCLEVSLATVKRRWRRARMRLQTALADIAKDVDYV